MDIQKVASLAHLPLSSNQQTLLSEQMDHILGYVSTLQQLQVADTILPATLKNSSRPDEIQPSLPVQPSYTVPGILDSD